MHHQAEQMLLKVIRSSNGLHDICFLEIKVRALHGFNEETAGACGPIAAHVTGIAGGGVASVLDLLREARDGDLAAELDMSRNASRLWGLSTPVSSVINRSLVSARHRLCSQRT